jgi:hypothetical protein
LGVQRRLLPAGFPQCEDLAILIRGRRGLVDSDSGSAKSYDMAVRRRCNDADRLRQILALGGRQAHRGLSSSFALFEGRFA